jgi:hypothetical protein
MILKSRGTADTSRLEKTSMHVVDTPGTRPFMQVIDILSAEEKPAVQTALDLGKCLVSGVWLCRDCIAAAHRIELPYQHGILIPCFGSSDLLYAVTVPESSGTAKRGKSAFGGDAGTGKHKQAILLTEKHRNATGNTFTLIGSV